MRITGSLAMVQETENEEEDRERDDGKGVKLGSLEGDLRWVNSEEAETEDGLKVAAVPAVAITESLSNSQMGFADKNKTLKVRVFIDSSFLKRTKKRVWSH